MALLKSWNIKTKNISAAKRDLMDMQSSVKFAGKQRGKQKCTDAEIVQTMTDKWIEGNSDSEEESKSASATQNMLRLVMSENLSHTSHYCHERNVTTQHLNGANVCFRLTS